MIREERLDSLIRYLKNENDGYASIREPINYDEKRRLLRSLMNVRWPGEASEEFMTGQDEFLTEEAEEKGIVDYEDIPVIGDIYTCIGIKNMDRISLWRGDITRLRADAIVNAANSQMLGCFVPCHGCIDNAIHSAAGLRLREACSRYMDDRRREDPDYEEPTGRAVLTPGFCLPCRYVIHTVGPVVGMRLTEELKQDLRNCYVSCLEAAADQGLRSIAFCCISTGEFHFPNDKGAEIAVDTVTKFIKQRKAAFDRIVFNVFKDGDRELYEKLLS